MKRFYNTMIEVVKKLNLFTSPVTLRYDLDPDYETFTGGCLTIILFALFFSIFLPVGVNVINKNQISTNVQNIKQNDPLFQQINTNDFMFALGVQESDMNDITQKKYFDVNMVRVDIINFVKKSTKFPLQACTLQHWEKFGQIFVEAFNKQSLHKFLCPPIDYNLQISGKYTSKSFIYYKISVDPCTGSSCATSQQIQKYILKNTSFKFNFFYTNILINPQQKQPITYFLQDKDYLQFTQKLGAFSNLYIGQFEMQTDQSLYPWNDINATDTFIINRAERQSSSYQITPTQSYAKLYLRKSDNKLHLERSFIKYDQFLSYIGGLFGLITIFFSLIMNYYGQCSFQLQLCQQIFDYSNKDKKKADKKQDEIKSNCFIRDQTMSKDSDKNQKQQKSIQPESFGIFDFFCHVIYKIISKLCKINWKRMQIYHESVEQMRYKLDVGHIIQKLAFFDRAINALFTQNQLKLLYLQQKFNFNQVRRQRKLLTMKNTVFKSISEILTSKKILNRPQEQPCSSQMILVQTQSQKARKRIQNFVIGNQFNFIQTLLHPNSQSQSLPIQIKNSLQQIQQSIYNGDQISKRIYNGLQYDLVDMYEKNKLKKEKNKKNIILQKIVGDGKVKGNIKQIQNQTSMKEQNNTSMNVLLGFMDRLT